MVAVVYLTIVSVFCGGMGFYLLWQRLRLRVGGRFATGERVRWEVRGLRTFYHHPVVRFRTDDGLEHEVVGAVGYGTPKERKRFRVLYAANTPEKAMIYSFADYWLAPLAFFVLAAGAGAAAMQQ